MKRLILQTVLIYSLFQIVSTGNGHPRWGSNNPSCQTKFTNYASCPNTAALGCCMYPDLFVKKIKRDCKNNALQVTSKNGSITYYEDSCFITCLFKASGYNANSNITGDFYKQAIPNIPMFQQYNYMSTDLLERCKSYYAAATHAQEFSNVYRKALNQLDPKRPLCNMKLAAIWDCVYEALLEYCPTELFIPTSACYNLQQTAAWCYFWGTFEDPYDYLD